MFLRKDQSIPLITNLALVLGKIRSPTRGLNLGKNLRAGRQTVSYYSRNQRNQMTILRTVFKLRWPKENPSGNSLIGAIQSTTLKGNPYLLRGLKWHGPKVSGEVKRTCPKDN